MDRSINNNERYDALNISVMLEKVNEAAFSKSEDEMYAAIHEANEILADYGLEMVRNEIHQCYTIGLSKLVKPL